MRLHQFVDVEEFGVAAGADHQIQIVVLGLPHVVAPGEGADVDVVVLIALVVGVVVEDRRAQTEVGEQPRLQVVELPVIGGARHVQPPRFDAVVIDVADETLGVGVGVIS